MVRAAVLPPGTLVFRPPLSPQRAPALLAAADEVLVMLRRESCYDASVPTKFVEGMAAGRSIVIAGGGESRRIVEGASAVWVADPEDPHSLAAVIAAWARDPERDARGCRARESAVAYLARGRSIALLGKVLSRAAAAGTAT
jgi:colanic acid biosynthesis glycosyl transferase WcaI